MQRLGLDFGPSSLGLSDAQKDAVMAHVFANPASAEVPLSQLVRLTSTLGFPRACRLVQSAGRPICLCPSACALHY
jgi:hypothetical protein